MYSFAAIETKFIPASNYRGARVKAWSADFGSVTVSYEHSGNLESHVAAVRAFCKKMKWEGTLVAGSTKNGFAFVFVDRNRAGVHVKSGEVEI